MIRGSTRRNNVGVEETQARLEHEDPISALAGEFLQNTDFCQRTGERISRRLWKVGHSLDVFHIHDGNPDNPSIS